MKAVVIAVAAALALGAGVASADQALATKKACMGCHKIEGKATGPALTDVAKKYKGDAKGEAHITGVIKNGGKGVWGNGVMPKLGVNDADAAILAKWVLSL